MKTIPWYKHECFRVLDMCDLQVTFLRSVNKTNVIY